MEFPIKDWEKLPIEVYKNALIEVKEYFGEYCSETESITNKSITTLISFVTFVAGAGIYILTKETNILIDLILFVFCFFDFALLYSLVKARVHYYRGLNATDFLNSDFDSEELNSKEKIRLFYYNSIQNYMWKIEEMDKIIEERAKKYNVFIFYTLALTVIISFYIGVIWHSSC